MSLWPAQLVDGLTCEQPQQVYRRHGYGGLGSGSGGLSWSWKASSSRVQFKRLCVSLFQTREHFPSEIKLKEAYFFFIWMNCLYVTVFEVSLSVIGFGDMFSAFCQGIFQNMIQFC